MISNIRAVIFDYGNVLCPMPEPSAFDVLARAAGIPSPQFMESLWRYRLDYDRGTLDGPAYWQQIAKDHGKTFSGTQIGRLLEIDLGLWTTPRPPMLAWAQRLRAEGLKTSILSNMPRDFSTHLRSKAVWLKDFDFCIFSGELQIIKPDSRIYRLCLEGLKLPPHQTLFIDDIAANVEGARSLGINAIRFESHAQLAAEVRRFDLPSLV